MEKVLTSLMAQHNNIEIPVKRYTRVDFTALRYKLNRLSDADIYSRLYNENDLYERGINSPHQLGEWLDELRDSLIERARLVNPLVSRNLEDARKFNRWPKAVVDFIINAGEKDQAQPKLDDSVAIWLKPVVSKILRDEGIVRLADLKSCIEKRGSGWWRPVPRIGPGKARAIERWLDAKSATLGRLARLPEKVPDNLVTLTPDGPQPLIPLERLQAVVSSLDGSQGLNRNHKFCLISAHNDLDAVWAYLYRYKGREKTLRAYQKELERFLLWCVCERRLSLSSVLTEECEAYKEFLANPTARWVGAKAPRNTPRWRPFEKPLAPQSQKYAVQALRAFFEWLVRVRYLGGNPWITVSDPVVATKELAIDIDKALPADLWESLAGPGGVLDTACAMSDPGLDNGALMQPKSPGAQHRQYRLARAAILLMGFTGIRREEAAGAQRSRLKPVLNLKGKVIPKPVWELSVLGKRNKWRTVFMPARVIEALKAHWLDRWHPFDEADSDRFLLSPIIVPNTPNARRKHLASESPEPNASMQPMELLGNGFSSDGLYQVVKTALLRLSKDKTVPLTEEQRSLLQSCAPHALRHTFASQAVAKEMPTDVLQRLLGHASLQTTSIYVQAERTRSIEESIKIFS